MHHLNHGLKTRLTLAAYPRSAKYDPEWVIENLMGPNVLWLAESLSQVMTLRPGMRVLDMGCGKAISSIFLAQEFDLEVWATDLWIPASENWRRILAAGLERRVCPIHAEAHTLPFAEGFFDAIVSLDAYHYFGTDDLYIGYFSKFVRPGGQIGIVVPGLVQELDAGVPEHLKPYWPWDFCSLHSPAWWWRHWDKTGKVRLKHADLVPDGWAQWLTWEEVCRDAGQRFSQSDIDLLKADAGATLGFSRIVAERVGDTDN